VSFAGISTGDMSMRCFPLSKLVAAVQLARGTVHGDKDNPIYGVLSCLSPSGDAGQQGQMSCLSPLSPLAQFEATSRVLVFHEWRATRQ
jgi:hypothetical protein